MTRLKNDYDFLAGIYIDGLHFNKYRLVIDLYTGTDSPKDQNIAFDRINYFIQEVVQRSVFVSEKDIKTIAMYAKAGIPVLTVPSPGPFDQVVQAVIITKLNAILEDTLVITESEISSVVGGFVTYIWDHEDTEDDIHDVVNNEVEELWWASKDPRFISLEIADEDDEEEKKKEHILSLTWHNLDLHWEDEEDEEGLSETGVIFKINPELVEESDTPAETVIKISDFDELK